MRDRVMGMELCFIGGGHVLKGELNDVLEELQRF